MKILRVINLSNNNITVEDVVIKAKLIKDFPMDSLSKDALNTIAAYVSSGVAKSFIYDKFVPVQEPINTVTEEETPVTVKRNKRK